MKNFTDDEIAALTQMLATDLNISQERTERAVKRAFEALGQSDITEKSFVEQAAERNRLRPKNVTPPGKE